MPAKGSKAKNQQVQEDQPAEQQFTSFDQVAAKLTSDFDLRFGKLERVLEVISAAVPALSQSDSEPPQKKQRGPAPIEPHQTRSRGPADIVVPVTKPVPHKIGKKSASATISKPPEDHTDAIPDVVLAQAPPPEVPAAILPLNQNINNNIPTWLTDEVQRVQPSSHPLPLSARDLRQNDSLDDQVHHILATTAHQLTKGNRNEKNFPCKYIIQGPERKPANVNTVSMQDHLWGISRMIRDSAVPHDIKPLLYVHLEEILEDARSYDWPSAVRAWSKECFSQMDEKRLSWHETAKIQLLRTSISRTSTAKLQPKLPVNKDVPNRPPRQQQQQQQFHSNYTNYDMYKGGPPCPEFNGPQGCNYQSGHLVSGRKMMHICSYCLAHTSALNPHPEAYCRNKQRHANYHF